MRRRKICELELAVDLEADGPILVKGGGESGILAVDMCFVRTRRGDPEGEAGDPYLPGTSLKGVIRSHAERVVRSLAGRDDAVCLPYEREEEKVKSCGSRYGEKSKREAYAKSCLACRLFGSLAFGGRVAIADAYLVDREEVPVLLEVRDGVAIDRRTGAAVPRAKFQFEVLVQGRFRTRVLVDNFESWQVGMLIAALEDLLAGRLPVGMGTSRGLGRMKGAIREVRARWYGKAPSSWAGIERLLPEEEAKRWGLFAGKREAPAVTNLARAGLAHEAVTTWDGWADARRFFLDEFADVAGSTTWPGARESA